MKNLNENETINYCYEDRFQLEDLENRRLYINDEINESTIDSITYHIFRYNRLDAGKPVDERKPIIIYINSPGGSVSDGFGVIDSILTSKTPVHTVNIAECYSMGFLIFLAGSNRYGMPSSTYLCHDGSSVAYGSIGKMRDLMEFETGQMEKHIRNYVISRTNITDKDYTENYRKEWYFYPEEAKKYGVITHIVGTDCDIDEIL